MLVSAILRSVVHRGSLDIIGANGRSKTFGDGTGPHVSVRLASKRTEVALTLNPALAIGEAYMDGRLIIEEGSLYDFIDLLAQNVGSALGGPWRRVLERIGRLRKLANLIESAERNIAHHYDLSPAFYDLFLDTDRQYSCAYFRHPDDTLEQAQAQKKAHIAAKLLLDRPGLKVLDIGSGWGGMACYLAESFGAEVTGVTLSREQHAYSVERAARSPARDRLHFELCDYRELTGAFDRVVSVGMFEHVGKRHYAEFFNRLGRRMAEDGIALIHSIGYSDTPVPINPFMRKYIFPGADLPSLSEIFTTVEPTGLFVTDLEILRLHYAETLRHWRARFSAQADKVRALYDERFYRMWEFYLVLCEVGFRRRTLMVFQMQLTRRIDRLPITRDYMFETEFGGKQEPASGPGHSLDAYVSAYRTDFGVRETEDFWFIEATMEQR
jgi:cyclopropane-fatty-acyl-phospholipid synthase